MISIAILMSKDKKIDIAAFIVAAAALIVSFLAWLDAHKQVKLTAGQVKSFVQVDEVKLGDKGLDASYIQVQLKIKNYGQTAAINVHGDMDYGDVIPDPEGKGNEATRRDFVSLGPGKERNIILQSNRINRRDWPTPIMRGDRAVYFWGTVWYTDDTTLENRKEDWCYKLVLKTEEDLKKTEVEPCGILTYKSKADN
jgi:hypothetical protein